MKIYLQTFLAALILASCGSPKQDKTSESDSSNVEETSAAAGASENTLSDAEKNNGWALLFDGKTLNGWRTFKNAENDSWEVSDGTLHCKPVNENGSNKRADLITVEKFANFEFTFDWKVAPQANTGIIYRVTEEFNQPFESGPEFQLIDDKGYPGDLQEWQHTGACYDMVAPSAERKLNPPGEWNQGKLVVNNNHVEHWLNGIKVVDYELLSDEWKKRKQQSKWKESPGYGLAKEGHLDLQDHQQEVWFRNLKLKKL